MWPKITVTLVQGIAVTNTSAKDVNGWFDIVTYPFSVEEGNNFTVAAGAIDSFHIKFVPNGAKGGNWQDTVSLTTAGAPPYAQLIINASRYNVNTGNVQYSTVDVYFKTIMAGTVDSEYVIAKNVGTTVLTVTANTLVHTGPFARFEGKSIHARPINPGDSLSVGLRFMPLVAGSIHDTLKTQSNDLEHPNVSIALHGIATPAMGVPQIVSRPVGVYPTIINTTVFVRSDGSDPLDVRVVDLLGRGA